MSTRLWKLPPTALKRDGAGWCVQSERGWGRAAAVFAPLAREGSSWQLALREHEELPVTTVDDCAWTPVPHGHIDASHYLCLLRYEQPLGRPDRTFRAKLRRDEFLPEVARPPHDAAMRNPVSVGAQELHAAFAQVHADVGERLSKYVVAAPRPARTEVPGALHFAFASCQYPAGMLDRRMAHASWRALSDHLEQPGAAWPERIVMLGDQVYVDATYGLLDPLRLDDAFRLAYEEFSDRETGPLNDLPQDAIDLARLIPDDHEIVDNWEPALPLPGERRFGIAMEAFWRHQRMGDAPRRDVQVVEAGAGWRLFMADTRTQRELRTADSIATATMLGADQTKQLRYWLRDAPRGDLKVVASSAMLLPRTRDCIDDPLYLDNWQGYPASLHALLAQLCDEALPNVVFLSGDAHLGCTARIRVANLGSRLHTEFHSHHAPALYAPYPFANESRHNLLTEDAFEFAWGGQRYRCDVEARILADGRNGCGWLTATRSGESWTTEVDVL
ncbi:MAG TPA: alkaline phosphatase D family protein [Ramlibacter sp.]|jgi:hypothetical protein|nr:alkaline phosphatase D family protein [Ramlibacter sp.]